MFNNSPAKPSQNKPWAILKASRRQYETARPWMNTKLNRKEFEEFLSFLPEGFIELLQLEADAERLLAAAFGEAAKTF